MSMFDAVPQQTSSPPGLDNASPVSGPAPTGFGFGVPVEPAKFSRARSWPELKLRRRYRLWRVSFHGAFRSSGAWTLAGLAVILSVTAPPLAAVAGVVGGVVSGAANGSGRAAQGVAGAGPDWPLLVSYAEMRWPWVIPVVVLAVFVGVVAVRPVPLKKRGL